MGLIFISHVEEDEHVAVKIAAGLEAAGYETWYYERDSVPGPTYLSQILSALARSEAVLLIISARSLDSGQVDKEVIAAFESGKPFIPLLRGVKHEEFKARRSTWAMAMGASVAIPIPARNPETIAPRIVAGLHLLQSEGRTGDSMRQGTIGGGDDGGGTAVLDREAIPLRRPSPLPALARRPATIAVGAGVLLVVLGLVVHAITGQSGGPVDFKSLALYSSNNFTYATCTPTGPSATSFSPLTPVIESYSVVSSWSGTHAVQDNWYEPNGSLYTHDAARTYTSSPGGLCEGVYVAKSKAARLPGVWSYQLTIDGRVAESKSFTLMTPVTVQSVKFYSDKGYQSQGCTVSGSSQPGFFTTVNGIVAKAFFPDWSGPHTVQDQWDAPDGTVYLQRKATTFNSIGSFCDDLSVAGTKAAGLTGTWTFKLLIDGAVAGSQTFTLGAPVTTQSIQFYSSSAQNKGGCTTSGPSTTTFLTTVTGIQSYVQYSSFNGKHRVQDIWYAPDGSMYWKDNATTFDSIKNSCDSIYIAGKSGARETGVWTYEVAVDGQVVGTKRFKLTEPHP